jgi:hypothetical protein
MHSVDVQSLLLAQRSVEDRLRISAELRNSAWTLRRSVIRRQHPDWTDLQVEDAVRAAFASVK